MNEKFRPFEGKIVILSYIECDYEGEDQAALVYRIVNGKLSPLYGVMRLPSGTCWNHYGETQYKVALKCILDAGVKEVCAPMFTLQGEDFFGVELGFTALSEELNERGEIECWNEFGGFLHEWRFYQLLREQGIKIFEINPETFEAVEVNW